METAKSQCIFLSSQSSTIITIVLASQYYIILSIVHIIYLVLDTYIKDVINKHLFVLYYHNVNIILTAYDYALVYVIIRYELFFICYIQRMFFLGLALIDRVVLLHLHV